MKKLISILLIAIMLFSFALAEDESTLSPYNIGDITVHLLSEYTHEELGGGIHMFLGNLPTITVAYFDKTIMSPKQIIETYNAMYTVNKEVDLVGELKVESFKGENVLGYGGFASIEDGETFALYTAFEYKDNAYAISIQTNYKEEKDFENVLNLSLTIMAGVLQTLEFN